MGRLPSSPAEDPLEWTVRPARVAIPAPAGALARQPRARLLPGRPPAASEPLAPPRAEACEARPCVSRGPRARWGRAPAPRSARPGSSASARRARGWSGAGGEAPPRGSQWARAGEPGWRRRPAGAHSRDGGRAPGISGALLGPPGGGRRRGEPGGPRPPRGQQRLVRPAAGRRAGPGRGRGRPGGVQQGEGGGGASRESSRPTPGVGSSVGGRRSALALQSGGLAAGRGWGPPAACGPRRARSCLPAGRAPIRSRSLICTLTLIGAGP